jgi:hypothetical protein
MLDQKPGAKPGFLFPRRKAHPGAVQGRKFRFGRNARAASRAPSFFQPIMQRTRNPFLARCLPHLSE